MGNYVERGSPNVDEAIATLKAIRQIYLRRYSGRDDKRAYDALRAKWRGFTPTARREAAHITDGGKRFDNR